MASHVAIEIKADKLICMTAKDRGRQNLGEWMSLPAAEKMLMEYEDNIMSKVGACAVCFTCQQKAAEEMLVHLQNSKPSKLRLSQEICEMSSGQEVSCLSDESDPMKQVNASWSWDLDSWQGRGVEMELVACIAACKNGVKRAHLVRCVACSVYGVHRCV